MNDGWKKGTKENEPVSKADGSSRSIRIVQSIISHLKIFFWMMNCLGLGVVCPWRQQADKWIVEVFSSHCCKWKESINSSEIKAYSDIIYDGPYHRFSTISNLKSMFLFVFQFRWFFLIKSSFLRNLEFFFVGTTKQLSAFVNSRIICSCRPTCPSLHSAYCTNCAHHWRRERKMCGFILIYLLPLSFSRSFATWSRLFMLWWTNL